MKVETTFEREFCSDLKELIVGCTIVKLNSRQGLPDRLVMLGDKYALLEFKQHEKAKHQPNQDYYVDKINSQGGFARFIYPENSGEILDELLKWFFD